MHAKAMHPVFLEAALLGANEVGGGAPGGSGTAVVKLVGDQVTFAEKWQGISAPLASHIHQAPVGVGGPVVVPFYGTPVPAGVDALAGSTTITTPGLADAIRANPSGFYINIHTKEFPKGAIRGQLHMVDRDDVTLRVAIEDADLTAVLLGANEIAGGDPNGHARAWFGAEDTSVSYALIWRGINPMAGHIHRGVAGVNGPIVVPLFSGGVPSSVFAIAGTVQNVDPNLIDQIEDNPAAFYTNLHTMQFPAGAVRGQLRDIDR